MSNFQFGVSMVLIGVAIFVLQIQICRLTKKHNDLVDSVERAILYISDFIGHKLK